LEKRAIFFDRDGVLNFNIEQFGRDRAPRNISEFKLYDEVPQCLSKLKEAGFILFVVSNQPDISMGLLSSDFINYINDMLKNDDGIDEIKICPHIAENHCICRKPKPGLLEELIQDFQINVEKSFIIGDRSIDMEAGSTVGLKTIYIKNRSLREINSQPKCTFAVSNLSEAVDIICTLTKGGGAHGII
jgi:D-glycero-D-manno-heptose 1,7-bisphosphate phosphatase